MEVRVQMYLTEIFRYVVSLSLSGSILVIGLLLIKILLRRKLSRLQERLDLSVSLIQGGLS